MIRALSGDCTINDFGTGTVHFTAAFVFNTVIAGYVGMVTLTRKAVVLTPTALTAGYQPLQAENFVKKRLHSNQKPCDNRRGWLGGQPSVTSSRARCF